MKKTLFAALFFLIPVSGWSFDFAGGGPNTFNIYNIVGSTDGVVEIGGNTLDGNLVSTGSVTIGNGLDVTGAGTFSGALTGTTLNTGQGANELYDMDQNVMTTSTPTFSSMTATNQINSASFKIGANDLTTSEWSKLDSIDQTLATGSTVTFASATITNQINTAGVKIGANELTTTEWANLDGQDQRVLSTSSPTFSSMTITGAAVISDTLTASKGISTSTATFSGVVTLTANLGLYSRTSAEIIVTTPTAIGQMLYDSTLKSIVIGSGTTTCFDWVNSAGTKPSGY